MSKKILHITPYFKPATIYGGPVFVIHDLAKELVGLGNEVTIFTTNANGEKDLEIAVNQPCEKDGIIVYYFKRWRKNNLFITPKLWQTLWKKANDFEVIHIHSWWNLTAIFAVLICWLKGIRPILSAHGMISNYSFHAKHSLLKKVMYLLGGKWLLNQVILHATVQQESAEWQETIPSWQHFICPNIVTLPNIKKSNKLLSKSGTFKLLFLSRIHEVKGIELLLAALKPLTINWELTIAGTGEEEYINSLKHQCRELGIAHKVNWIGWISGEKKQQILQDNDLFILPSKNENFAVVVLESLAVGTPVLLSKEVGLGPYVKEQDFGWICERNTTAFSTAILETFADITKRKRIQRNAPQQVRKDFASREIALQYITHYEQFFQKKVFVPEVV